MVKLKEVRKKEFRDESDIRYTLHDLFINPSHVRAIRPHNVSGPLKEGLVKETSARDFCVLSLEREDVIVVGSVLEIRKKLMKKEILHG